MNNVIHLVTVNDEPRVDSVEIAERLGTGHKATIQLIRRYTADFSQLGRVPFEMRPFATRGGEQAREVALLNEDQCYLLLSYSRNTPKVRGLKVSLVQAFGNARRNGVAQALSVWQELQRLQMEDANSLARASFGSHLMLDRKRALPTLRDRRRSLERQFEPQLKLAA